MRGRSSRATSKPRSSTVDPFVSIDVAGVGELVRIGTERGRAARPGLKVGICGEHGGDPKSVAFFDEVGLDYVSCSPFRVPIARLAAAQAAILARAARPPTRTRLPEAFWMIERGAPRARARRSAVAAAGTGRAAAARSTRRSRTNSRDSSMPARMRGERRRAERDETPGDDAAYKIHRCCPQVTPGLTAMDARLHTPARWTSPDAHQLWRNQAVLSGVPV